MKVVEPGRDHRAADRGGAPCDHAPSQARRPRSGSGSSRTCRCRKKPAEVRMGKGKGSVELWVAPGQAGPDHVRDRRRAGGCSPPRRSAWAPPSCRSARGSCGACRRPRRRRDEGERAARARAPGPAAGPARAAEEGAVQLALPEGHRPAREHGAGARRCGATSRASRPCSASAQPRRRVEERAAMPRRILQGTVVSDKGDKTVDRLGRAPRHAPDLQEVHPSLEAVCGARRRPTATRWATWCGSPSAGRSRAPSGSRCCGNRRPRRRAGELRQEP